MKKSILAAILLLGAVSAQAGEKPMSLSLYPYGGWWFGDEYLNQGWTAGGRVGFNFSEVIGLELGYEYFQNELRAYPEPDVVGQLPHADVLIHFLKTRKLSPYILVGGGDLMIDVEDSDDPADAFAFMWGLGLKAYLNEVIGLRIEARHIDIEDESAANLLVTGGIQVRLGGRWPSQPVARPSDSDGDGVVDGSDQCPNTPAGATVDAIGCPADSDGDGVLNGIDACPDTPRGATVNAKGCSSDTDGDTVPDGIDNCPGTLAGTQVNALGCSLDADGDTVADANDKCPGTPAGKLVDATGCYEEAAARDGDGDTVEDSIDKCPRSTPGSKIDENGCEIIAERMVLEGVNFASGKSLILKSSYPVLDSAAQTLKANPHVKVEIQGYTDSKGAYSSNVKLSQARARAVYNYLVKKGVPASQMTYKGYGPDSPIADNNTNEGRAKNRRIEFRVID